MAHEWIKAHLALRYAADSEDQYSAKSKIIERAHGGLIVAKAEKMIWGDVEQSNRLVPKVFWQFDELNGLIEDWEQGDFARLVNGEIDAKLFGVSFDFIALSELVPTHAQAAALRAISLLSDAEWISAQDLQKLMFAKHNPAKVERAIVEACQLGQIGSRASRMTCEESSGVSRLDPTSSYAAMEWDVPLWFWRDFVGQDDFQDWSLNKAHGSGQRGGRWLRIELQGVHFHRSGLMNLGLVDRDSFPKPEMKGGRKPKYDWPAASLAVFGEIHRGDLKPESQADIERALITYLGDESGGPSESTVRPYAKTIWDEAQKA